MDIQPVSITYTCACLSKIEDECSHALIRTFKKDADANCSNYEQMRLIVCTFCLKEKAVCKTPHTTLCQNYGFKRHFQQCCLPTQTWSRIDIVFVWKRLNWKNSLKTLFIFFRKPCWIDTKNDLIRCSCRIRYDTW